MAKKTETKEKKAATQKAAPKGKAATAAKPEAEKKARPQASSKPAPKAAAKKAPAKKPAPGKKKPSQAKPEAKDAQGAAASSGEKRQTPILPQPTFTTFILSLASSGMVQLGEVPHPDTGGMELDLNLAKHTIDTITMLQEKTQNCLTAEEKRLVDGVLYELRMKYVMKK